MGGLLGGGKGSKNKIPTIDTSKLIAENEAVNRVGVETPFGSQHYITTPDGHRVLRTTLSPEAQYMLSQQMNRAQRETVPYQLPNGQNELLANVMARMRGKYQPPVDQGTGP